MRDVFFDRVHQDKFDADGIVISPLLNADEIHALLSIYKTYFNNATELKFHSTMFINDAAYRKKIDAAIRSTVAGKINSLIKNYRLLFANFIVKESAAETGVGIHQDWNFTSPDFTSLNIWIPLVDIDEGTGLFYALKGSHLTFRNIRYTPYPDNAYGKIKEYVLKNSTGYRLKAGEAIIYNGALVHYSEPNNSGKVRVAIGLALIPDEAPCLHYYKRNPDDKALEIYETDEAFYNRFNFFEEPKGAKKTGIMLQYKELPSIDDLM